MIFYCKTEVLKMPLKLKIYSKEHLVVCYIR